MNSFGIQRAGHASSLEVWTVAINSTQNFHELITKYHANPDGFIFFVGAGLSQPLFPAWKALLIDFVETANEDELPCDKSELMNYIESGDQYLEVADACISGMGTTRYRDFLEKHFDKDITDENLPEGYKLLMDLSPKTIITTNYDRIPDVAGRGLYRVGTNNNASEMNRSLSQGKKIVFKIHGDITDHKSIILNTSDYQDVIFNNMGTKTLLGSMLSTKTVVFIGFSLSDPHIDIILGGLKSIYNFPIAHYVLLNEKSGFKTLSFEKKYGLKVISYTPSDDTHPEVSELLRALSHKANTAPEQIEKTDLTISDNIELMGHVESLLSKIIIHTAFSIFIESKSLIISFSTSGGTKSETQKEVLSIIRSMNFHCPTIDRLEIIITAETQPLVNVDECQPSLLKATLSFNDAQNYAAKKTSTSSIWKQIDFYLPSGLSNYIQEEDEMDFPLSLGIIES